jgi:conjugative transfer signal peptidase TraF
MNRRRIVATLVVASLFSVRLALQQAGLRVNLTASEPRGLYLTEQKPWRRGSFVIFRLPARLSAIALERGYALPGSTAGAVMDGLKRVAALPGDTVRVGPQGVSVNGVLWPASKPLRWDSSGHHPIQHYPFGVYHVGPGQVWLLSDNPRGWDSRYFGPLPRANVISAARPLLTSR